MRSIYRTLTLTGIIAVFSVSAIGQAFASTEGRKNTAIAITAATAYSALKKNDRAALVGALATAQAWKNYEDSRKQDNQKKAYTPSRAQRSSTAYQTSTPRRSSTTYRKASTATKRSYTPVRKSQPAKRTYPIRPAVQKTTYTRPQASASSATDTQVTQLKTQVASLQGQLADMKRQNEMNQLRTENEALKAQLANERTLVADAQTGHTPSKWLPMLVTGVLAALGTAALAFGRIGRK